MWGYLPFKIVHFRLWMTSCFILMTIKRSPIRIAINFLEENNIEMLSHPPINADLNPIENI